MGKYTVRKGKGIDEEIEKHMKQIRKALIFLLGKENIVSIFLVGGFGRGEGSVLTGKKTTPLNDYDLILITNTNLNLNTKRKIKELSISLAKKFQIDFIDIDIVSYSNLDRFKKYTISNYEISKQRIKIYGKQLNFTKFHQKHIPLVEATRTMLNRTGGMLFSKQIVSDLRTTKEVKKFTYIQCMKMILSIGDAFLLLAGNYSHSYKKRSENINTVKRLDSNFIKLYKKFSKFKLEPSEKDFKNLNIEKIWNLTSQYHYKYFLLFEEERTKNKFKNILEWNKYYLNEKTSSLSFIDKLKFLLFNFIVFGFPIYSYDTYWIMNSSERRQSSLPLILYGLSFEKKYLKLASKILNVKSSKKLIFKLKKIWHEFPPFYNKLKRKNDKKNNPS